jgi:hypothetical protein
MFRIQVLSATHALGVGIDGNGRRRKMAAAPRRAVRDGDDLPRIDRNCSTHLSAQL